MTQRPSLEVMKACVSRANASKSYISRKVSKTPLEECKILKTTFWKWKRSFLAQQLLSVWTTSTKKKKSQAYTNKQTNSQQSLSSPSSRNTTKWLRFPQTAPAKHNSWGYMCKLQLHSLDTFITHQTASMPPWQTMLLLHPLHPIKRSRKGNTACIRPERITTKAVHIGTTTAQLSIHSFKRTLHRFTGTSTTSESRPCQLSLDCHLNPTFLLHTH